MKVLVTGASGFIGRRVLAALSHSGDECRVFGRSGATGVWGKYECILGDLSDRKAMGEACSGIDCVFHCAGYAHAFGAQGDEEARLQWAVNYEGTRSLVSAAAVAGVRRLVFLSSVKAMGDPEAACVDECFAGLPESEYGRAKRAAEDVVLEAGAIYGMHVVNLRLSMVYGAGGHGNLERMGRLVRRGIFPPLPETGNRRSMVHVVDAVGAMMLAATDDRASGETYIVAGPEAPSGRELYQAMRSVLGMNPSHWALPEGVIRAVGSVGDIGGHLLQRRLPVNSEAVGRLLDSACYSSGKIAKELGWSARVSLHEGLAEMFGL